jgi:HPt (histidine-containing phosphotransfer) domain-containing protein
MNTDGKKPTSSPSPSSILDEEVIAQLRNLGVLEEIGRSFLDEGPKFIGELRQAIHQRDAAALRHTAHTLKGVSAATGAKRIKADSEQLEGLGKAGVTEGAEQLLTQVEQDFKDLAHAFEDAWTRSK